MGTKSMSPLQCQMSYTLELCLSCSYVHVYVYISLGINQNYKLRIECDGFILIDSELSDGINMKTNNDYHFCQSKDD
jgi:hypothetical protein